MAVITQLKKGNTNVYPLVHMDGVVDDNGNSIGTIKENSQRGIDSITSQEDGTIIITLLDGNTFTINLNHVHPQYYSKPLYLQTIPQTGLLPNIEYDYGTTDIVNVVLNTTDIDQTIANEWHFFFTAQSASCSVTLPNDVRLGNGYTWNIVAGRTFEVTIKHNIAYVGYCDP